MIRMAIYEGQVNDRAVKLVPDDVDVLYERSVLHGEHGSVKKVCSWRDEIDCRPRMGL